MPKEGASRFEADERREFVHPEGDKNQTVKQSNAALFNPSQSRHSHTWCTNQPPSITIRSPLDPMSSIFLKVQ